MAEENRRSRLNLPDKENQPAAPEASEQTAPRRGAVGLHSLPLSDFFQIPQTNEEKKLRDFKPAEASRRVFPRRRRRGRPDGRRDVEKRGQNRAMKERSINKRGLFLPNKAARHPGSLPAQRLHL